MWKKGPIYRIEYPEYPERAVQEGIVNALIHRDYSVIGSEVHLDIYDDRLEISSPGGMYDGTFIQNIDPYKVSSSRRNPLLADLFARMNLMERRGSGLKKIIEAYKSCENYKEELKPEFRSTESAFFTVLRNLNYDTQNDGQSEGQNDTQKLKPKDRQEKIIHIMKDTSNITALELSDILSVSIITIKRDLKKLTDEKVIEYVGSAKGGHWVVKK
ncbi:MAG: ATP-binding protein [Peptostreptococcaceae bacterium]|nr:ATP-binding protein [Peptostreptococcaceae bacterium]